MNIRDTLNSEQLSALQMVVDNQVSILCGAPGVGKTYTLKAILEGIKFGKVTLAAPTGKAAKRMSEATGRDASTIHRLLGPMPGMDGGFVFSFNDQNLLLVDFIVIDETSMVPTGLLADLLRAVGPETGILFVGDPDQLPSVGAGSCLRDMINSGCIPVTRLTEIQRNSGDIVKACHRIKDGKSYVPSPKLDPESGLNLRHIEEGSPWKIQDIVLDLVTEKMPKRGYDPLWDVQVLSAVNDRGELSCKDLNGLLKLKLNSTAPPDEKWSVGDKVINTKNMTVKGSYGLPEYIVNGDMGTIVDTEGKFLTVEFRDPPRTVDIFKGENYLLHAYCITCHRMQGSEAPVIIIPIHTSFGLIDRTWIYTAISRAKTICITVGQFEAVQRAIAKETAAKRKTYLQERIQREYYEQVEI